MSIDTFNEVFDSLPIEERINVLKDIIIKYTPLANQELVNSYFSQTIENGTLIKYNNSIGITQIGIILNRVKNNLYVCGRCMDFDDFIGERSGTFDKITSIEENYGYCPDFKMTLPTHEFKIISPEVFVFEFRQFFVGNKQEKKVRGIGYSFNENCLDEKIVLKKKKVKITFKVSNFEFYEEE